MSENPKKKSFAGRYSFGWKSISKILSTPSVALLSVFLFVVPALDNILHLFEGAVSGDPFWLYVAGFLATVATICTAILKPAIFRLDTLDQAHSEGLTLATLKAEFLSDGGNLEELTPAARTPLDNSDHTTQINGDVFYEVRSKLDTCKPVWRFAITLMLFGVFASLAYVHGGRAVNIAKHKIEAARKSAQNEKKNQPNPNH